MTIFQLECYYALAQSLNFTQTASQQYITQPALSRSISSLEKELGIKLVNRTTHTVSLTPAGRVFAEECRKIISTYQDGVQNALTASQSIVGRVRLGVPIDSFEPLAVKLVRAITEKHSGIHIELKFNTPTRLLRALDDDLVDVIIASGRPRSAESKYLLVDRRMDYVVISSVHPLAERKSPLASCGMKTLSLSPVPPPLPGISPLLTTPQPAGFLPISWEKRRRFPPC